MTRDFSGVALYFNIVLAVEAARRCSFVLEKRRFVYLGMAVFREKKLAFVKQLDCWVT